MSLECRGKFLVISPKQMAQQEGLFETSRSWKLLWALNNARNVSGFNYSRVLASILGKEFVESQTPQTEIHREETDSDSNGDEDEFFGRHSVSRKRVPMKVSKRTEVYVPGLNVGGAFSYLLDVHSAAGDVQFCVIALLVLGLDVGLARREALFEAYIDRLWMLESWIPSLEMRVVSGIARLQSKNQEGTTVYTCCGGCGKGELVHFVFIRSFKDGRRSGKSLQQLPRSFKRYSYH